MIHILIVKPSLSSVYYNLIFNIALGEQIHLELIYSLSELPNLKTIGFSPKCTKIPCKRCDLYKLRPFEYDNSGEMYNSCGIAYSVRKMINLFPLKK